jgi:hypothetical protein
VIVGCLVVENKPYYNVLWLYCGYVQNFEFTTSSQPIIARMVSYIIQENRTTNFMDF